MKKLCDLFTNASQRMKANSLEIELETLKSVVKDELYKEFMKKLGEPTESDRLKKENKRLRIQVRSLKDIIREGK